MPLTATVPSTVVPVLNTTEPVAAPPNWLFTVAVNVIGWLTCCGFIEEVTTVVVAAVFTV